LEIERNLAAAAKILDERTAIVADVDEAGLDAHDITSILATAAEWSARLRSEAEASTALKSLVDRAELHQDGIRLSIRLPIRTSGKPAASAATHLSLTRQIPLRVRRRGIEMRLVIGGGSSSSPRGWRSISIWARLQNGQVERLIGSIRRESLDHLVVFDEAQLRHVLKNYASCYNQVRTHLSLDKNAPDFRRPQKLGLAATSILGGLHHQYLRA
jgi:hypothetical protein